jgi:hypothetical protein
VPMKNYGSELLQFGGFCTSTSAICALPYCRKIMRQLLFSFSDLRTECS